MSPKMYHHILLSLNPTQTNTYQAIIISDGRETYSIFTYNCDELNWAGAGNDYASVGFSVLGTDVASGFTQNFANYPLSRLPQVSMVACENTPLNRPWTNLVYRVGVAVSSEQIGRAQCLAGVAEDERRFPSLLRDREASSSFGGNELGMGSLDCPCSVQQALLDDRFILEAEFASLGDNSCLFSRFSVEYDGFYVRYRCCYDSTG